MLDIDISHAVDERWAGQRNGVLIEVMLARGFRILVTVDRNLQFQQNISASGVAVIVLHARSNRLSELQPMIPALREALARVRQGEILHARV
jgi:hypothetical protein